MMIVMQMIELQLYKNAFSFYLGNFLIDTFNNWNNCSRSPEINVIAEDIYHVSSGIHR